MKMDHHIKALEAMLAEGMTQEGVVETTKALAQCKIAVALERIMARLSPATARKLALADKVIEYVHRPEGYVANNGGCLLDRRRDGSDYKCEWDWLRAIVAEAERSE